MCFESQGTELDFERGSSQVQNVKLLQSFTPATCLVNTFCGTSGHTPSSARYYHQSSFVVPGLRGLGPPEYTGTA